MTEHVCIADGVAVEVDVPSGTCLNASVSRDVNNKLGEGLKRAFEVAGRALEGASSLKANEVEIEFGLRVSIDGGVPLWVFSKAGAEANFKVRVKWDREC